MNTKQAFLKLVSQETADTVGVIKKRVSNRTMLRESRLIAMKVLKRLSEKGWSQKDLARVMGVTPQQINKITSGKENLTLSTQTKLQEALDIPILASYYENRAAENNVSTNREGLTQYIHQSSDQQLFIMKEPLADEKNK